MFKLTIFLFTALPLVLCLTQQTIKLDPVELSITQLPSLSPEELQDRISSSQSESVGKLLHHFISYLREQWAQLSLDEQTYKHKLLNLFSEKARESTER